MKSTLRAAFTLFVALTILTGIAYPLFVTLVAQGVFSHKANGSLVVAKDGKIQGSELIGQTFDKPEYFWSRPSATTPSYNGASSSGSNQGPTNDALLKAIDERVKAIKEAHPDQKGPVPVDLVTASGSGLDPHISLAAAEYQVSRVAAARKSKLSEIDVRRLVAEHTEGRTFGLLGEPRVNVLQLNRSLDAAAAAKK